jgi:hypothetical protein
MDISELTEELKKVKLFLANLHFIDNAEQEPFWTRQEWETIMPSIERSLFVLKPMETVVRYLKPPVPVNRCSFDAEGFKWASVVDDIHDLIGVLEDLTSKAGLFYEPTFGQISSEMLLAGIMYNENISHDEAVRRVRENTARRLPNWCLLLFPNFREFARNQ